MMSSRSALAEDVGAGDLTTQATVPDGRPRARRTITQKAPGVLFGLDVAEQAFALPDPDVARSSASPPEGDWHEPRRRCCGSTGRAAGILTAERTALNLLQRLSGVATLTARYVEAIEGTGAQDPRHAQDDAGAAGAGEGGRARRAAAPTTASGSSTRSSSRRTTSTMAGGVGAAVRAAQAALRPTLPLEVRGAARSPSSTKRSRRAPRVCCWTT